MLLLARITEAAILPRRVCEAEKGTDSIFICLLPLVIAALATAVSLRRSFSRLFTPFHQGLPQVWHRVPDYPSRSFIPLAKVYNHPLDRPLLYHSFTLTPVLSIHPSTTIRYRKFRACL